MRSYIKNKTCRLVTGFFFLPFCSTFASPFASASASLVEKSALSKVFRPGKQTYISFDDTCGASEKADLSGLFLTDHSES